jgi:hypothetical protein
VLDTTSHKNLLVSYNYDNTLQDSVAPIRQVTIMHAPILQTPGHLKSTPTHLSMRELVIIVATLPLLSHHKDQSNAEAPDD